MNFWKAEILLMLIFTAFPRFFFEIHIFQLYNIPEKFGMLQSCPAERRVHAYCHLGEARTFINRGAICPFTSGCTLLAFEAINLSDNCPGKHGM